MRLFISYARVDRYYCSQIVDMLDVHDVWYDNRLHAGQQWWEEIQRRLEWCEGVIYLLSPDSVNSEYCQRELQIANAMGKHIFPVLIQARTEIPETLRHIQYADLSKGLTTDAVKLMLNSIYIAERTARQNAVTPNGTPVFQMIAPVEVPSPLHENTDFDSIMDEVGRAFEEDLFDRAVFLLRQLRERQDVSNFIDLEQLLLQAEDALEQQAYLRDAEREYRPIAVLLKYRSTREVGKSAFQSFQQKFPDYDPDNLGPMCEENHKKKAVAVQAPPGDEETLVWCDIPSGVTTLLREESHTTQFVDAFRISRYPVTNQQFLEFVNALDGYCRADWWDYSISAVDWHKNHHHPPMLDVIHLDHPCVYVNWYDALAYCRWLSSKINIMISLPTETQWQRAAQGDEEQAYPWGEDFNTENCNTKESRIGRTTSVYAYPGGASPYGVMDLAGNTWDWCLNNNQSSTGVDLSNDLERVIKGGAYHSPAKRAVTSFYFAVAPGSHHDSISFRLVCPANV